MKATGPTIPIASLKEISDAVAGRIRKRYHYSFSHDELFEKVFSLGYATYEGVFAVRNCPITSWTMTEALTDTDNLICVVDRIVHLQACSFFRSTTHSDLLDVLGTWEYREPEA